MIEVFFEIVDVGNHIFMVLLIMTKNVQLKIAHPFYESIKDRSNAI